MRDDVVERLVRQKAEIDRSGRGDARLRLELASSLMEVELLLAERESAPAIAERDRAHAQSLLIEGQRAFDVAHGQHDVVDRLDVHDRARAQAPAVSA